MTPGAAQIRIVLRHIPSSSTVDNCRQFKRGGCMGRVGWTFGRGEYNIRTERSTHCVDVLEDSEVTERWNHGLPMRVTERNANEIHGPTGCRFSRCRHRRACAARLLSLAW